MSLALIVLGLALIVLGGWERGLMGVVTAAGGFLLGWGLLLRRRRWDLSGSATAHLVPDPALGWLRRAHNAIGVWAMPTERAGKTFAYFQSVDPSAGLNPGATNQLRARLRSAPKDLASGIERLDTGTLVSESNGTMTVAMLLPSSPSAQAVEQAREDLQHLLQGLGRGGTVLRSLEEAQVRPVESVSSIALRLAHQIERTVGVQAVVALAEPSGVRVVAASPGADQRLVGQVVPPESPVALVALGEKEAQSARGDVFGGATRDRRRGHMAQIAIQSVHTRDGAVVGAVAYWRPRGGAVHLTATAEISEHIRRAAPRLRASLEHEAMGLQATLDPLTRLRNRRGFETVTRQVGRAEGAMIYADLDRFKALNESLGRSAGDAALVHFAEIIRKEIRQRDVAGRIGGEEFAVWLPDASLAEALRVADRIRSSLGASPFAWKGRAWPLSASLGVAACPETARNHENLAAQAHAALDQAKAAGRNRVEAARSGQAGGRR